MKNGRKWNWAKRQKARTDIGRNGKKAKLERPKKKWAKRENFGQNGNGWNGIGRTGIKPNKMLALSKLKVFADDKLIVIQNSKVFFNRVENIVGTGENAGYQHFFFFPQYFQKAIFSRHQKSSLSYKGLRMPQVWQFMAKRIKTN